MIETFAQLEEVAADRDLADVFLEHDEEEHGVSKEQILETLRKRHAVMWECVNKGHGDGISMGKLVGHEAKMLAQAVSV